MIFLIEDIKNRDPLALFTISLGLTVLILLSLWFFIWSPEYEKQYQSMKIDIDSKTCQDLGKWIIQHSTDYNYFDSEGKFYKINLYAQAKYLVCTHTLGTTP